MGFRSIDLAALLEAVYRVEQADAPWLNGILQAVRPGMDNGMGMIGYFTDVSGPDPVRFWGVDTVGPDLSLVLDICARSSEHVPPRAMCAIHTCAPCGVWSYAPPQVFKEISKEKWKAVVSPPIDVVDMAGVTGMDATGQGCVLLAWLPRTPEQPPGGMLLELWERISVHVATAARLRRKLAGDNGRVMSHAEAILSPGGRLEYATGVARDKLARSALREAVVSMDRARTRRNRLDPAETSELWQALAEGRWSLVDYFDSDGRRFVVAHRNELPTVAPAPLTAREGQVVRAAALGHSNKVIAYELGIAISTVGTHLSNAAMTVGASNRMELIDIMIRFEHEQLARSA